jgi:hypothetical protein
MINLINNIDNNICCKTVCIRWPKLRLFNFGVNLKINRTCDCREMRECTCVVIALHMIVVWMHGVYVPGMHACMHGMHECTCDYWGLGEDWFVTVVVSAISMCTCGASCPGLANQHGVVSSRRPSSAAVRPAVPAPGGRGPSADAFMVLIILLPMYTTWKRAIKIRCARSCAQDIYNSYIGELPTREFSQHASMPPQQPH